MRHDVQEELDWDSGVRNGQSWPKLNYFDHSETADTPQPHEAFLHPIHECWKDIRMSSEGLIPRIAQWPWCICLAHGELSGFSPHIN